MDHLLAMRAFVRAAELGNFSAVARELHVKQSTISKWMRQLEEEHGVVLIQRSSRRQHLTEQGELFYTQSKQILAIYEQTSEDLRQRHGALSGRLRVALPVVFGERFFARALTAFGELHPGIELELELDDRYIDLLERRVDLSIRVGSPVDSSLHAITIARLRRCLVASPSYCSRRGWPSSPEELSNHDALLHTFTGQAHWSFEREDGSLHRVELQSANLCANHSGVLLDMAMRGQGIALIADWLVAPLIHTGRLVELLPDTPRPPAFVQVLAPSPHLSIRAERLIAYLKTSIRRP